ncbi:MAG TPA: hypothetical protein VMG10_34440 [Gemmataceae bacterium]|nr:hypothetical protein [Gemmataceae bacterium]
MNEQDSPWKEALERYLPSFLALYFPAVHAAINWTRGYEWLNTELRQVVRDAELGKRLADVLVKVWRHDGEESWLLIHIEVQGWPEQDFAQRLFVYHYRIFDRYNRQVVTLAVLADDRANWRPDRFAYDVWGCRLDFQFPVLKLLDFVGREAILEASDNPFALVTRAHLATLQTRQDAGSRHAWKVQLVRELYERGMSRDDVLQLFRIIDWMMDLPAVLEQLFKQEAEQIEQERTMPYVTSVERLAIREERIHLLIRALERRLKITVPEELAARIRGTTDPALLEKWFDLACEAASLEEFQQRMQS